MLEELRIGNQTLDDASQGKDQDIIEQYVNPGRNVGHGAFNDPLRRQGGMAESEVEKIIALQKALLREKEDTSSDIKEYLWRGSGTLIGNKIPQEGETVIEPAFLSTSKSKEMAEAFQKKSQNGYLIKISQYKSGKKVKSLGSDTGRGKEEVLFPAMTPFVFLAKEGNTHLYAEAGTAAALAAVEARTAAARGLGASAAAELTG